MTNIVQMSKGGTKFYPQTHVQAVLGLPDLNNYPTKSDVTTEISEQIKANQPDLSGFQKTSDVQTAITTALGKIDTSQTMNASTRTKLQSMNKEMGS